MKNIVVIAPSYSQYYHKEFVQNLIGLVNAGASVISLTGCSNIIESRNNCIHQMLVQEKQKNKRFEYVLFIDCDVAFNPEYINKMILHDKDIVSGLYFAKTGNFGPTAGYFGNMYETGQAMPLSKKEILSKQLIEIDWCGLGLTLVKREVFDKLKYPWFEAIKIDLKQSVERGGIQYTQVA